MPKTARIDIDQSRARRSFDRFIKDGSGMIRAHDFRAAMKHLGYPLSEEQCRRVREHFEGLAPDRLEPSRIPLDLFVQMARFAVTPPVSQEK